MTAPVSSRGAPVPPWAATRSAASGRFTSLTNALRWGTGDDFADTGVAIAKPRGDG
jgi:hypothetical protein